MEVEEGMETAASILIAVAVLVSSPMNSGGGWVDMTDTSAVTGLAAYYRPGLMAQVAVARGYVESHEMFDGALESDGFVGAVALYRYGDYKARDSVYLVWVDEFVIDGPYKVLDVVARGHYADAMEKGMVVDVDYQTSVRHEMKSPVRVIVIYDFDSIEETANEIQKQLRTCQ